MPWTAKELLPIAGIAGLYAIESRAETLPPGSAWLAERMEAAGAILVARTSSPALGAIPTTENYRGACSNPHDPERTSGGSSGGAGVCAALAVAPFNHGSDAGGSIRIPAAWSGAVGLKPSRNRITRGPYANEGWGGLSVEGPLTSTVEDAAWFLDICAGPGIGDSAIAPPAGARFLDLYADERPKRVAMAISRDDLAVAPAMEHAVRAAAERLAGLGHQIVEATPEGLDKLEEGFGAASCAGIASMPLNDAELDALHPRTRRLWEQGQEMPGGTLFGLLDVMHRRARRVVAWFEDYDALLTPTLARTAPKIGELGADPKQAWSEYRVVLQWTWPFNVTGQPAISIPFGSSEGLPVGVQLVGRIGDEGSILALARQLRRR